MGQICVRSCADRRDGASDEKVNAAQNQLMATRRPMLAAAQPLTRLHPVVSSATQGGHGGHDGTSGDDEISVDAANEAAGGSSSLTGSQSVTFPHRVVASMLRSQAEAEARARTVTPKANKKLALFSGGGHPSSNTTYVKDNPHAGSRGASTSFDGSGCGCGTNPIGAMPHIPMTSSLNNTASVLERGGTPASGREGGGGDTPRRSKKSKKDKSERRRSESAEHRSRSTTPRASREKKEKKEKREKHHSQRHQQQQQEPSLTGGDSVTSLQSSVASMYRDSSLSAPAVNFVPHSSTRRGDASDMMVSSNPIASGLQTVC